MGKTRRKIEEFKKHNTQTANDLLKSLLRDADIKDESEAPLTKRTRRNADQLLTDCIVDLYTKIESKIKSIDDQKKVVSEIFEALDPLIVLHKVWRENNDRYSTNDN